MRGNHAVDDTQAGKQETGNSTPNGVSAAPAGLRRPARLRISHAPHPADREKQLRLELNATSVLNRQLSQPPKDKYVGNIFEQPKAGPEGVEGRMPVYSHGPANHT